VFSVTKPKISVIYPTCRIGGVDILVDAMENQSFKDFEVILVDELYDFRKGMVDDYAKKHGVNIRHVKPKHLKGVPFQLANNMNTGLLWAEGELIVVLEDYMWAGADWLKMHWDLYRKFSTLVVGNLRFVPLPETKWETRPIMRNRQFHIKEEEIAEGWISIFKKEFKGDTEKLERQVYIDDYRKLDGFGGPLIDGRYKFIEGKWFWGNMSIPLETILNLNGWDEHYDGGHGYREIDVGERAELLGQKILYDPENRIYHFDHSALFQMVSIFGDNHIYHDIRMERIRADVSLIPAPNPYNIRRWRDVLRGRVKYEGKRYT